MQKFGASLVALGILGFVYAAIGMQLRILQWLPRDQQMIACGGMLVVGLVLAGIGRLTARRAGPPAQAAPPPGYAPAAYAPPATPPGIPPGLPPNMPGLPPGMPPVPGAPPSQYAGYYGSPPPGGPPPGPPPAPTGRAHHPVVAAVAAVLVPGAGQAYNGKPMRAFFLVLLMAVLAALLIARWPAATAGTFDFQSLQRPAQIMLGALAMVWLLSVLGAYFGARRIRATTGRLGKGGLFWVILQCWLVANAIGFVAVGLTIGGVLR